MTEKDTEADEINSFAKLASSLRSGITRQINLTYALAAAQPHKVMPPPNGGVYAFSMPQATRTPRRS